MDEKQKTPVDSFANLTKYLSILIIVGVIAYKLIVSPFAITIDVATLLSLLLALFAIYLSALFYFKATETSNSFYDNTYKFTKDIAELLVRIESGFGERLRHLDESYSKIQDRFDKYARPEEIAETQKEADKSQEELEAKVKERDNIINELFERSNLKEKEKSSILDRLKQAEDELISSREQLTFYKSELAKQSLSKDDFDESPNDRRFRNVILYTRSSVFGKFLDPADVAQAPTSVLSRKWKNSDPSKLPTGFLRDLRILSFITSNNSLTHEGATFFRTQARELIGFSDSNKQDK